MVDIQATIDRGPITPEQKADILSFIIVRFLKNEVKGISITPDGIRISFDELPRTTEEG